MIEILKEKVLPIAAAALVGAIGGAGLLPLLPLGNESPPDEEPPPPTSVTTIMAPPASSIIEVEASQPTVPGIDQSISEALAQSGYVIRLDRAQLEAEIDPEIVRVLEESDAVVTVFESEDAP